MEVKNSQTQAELQIIEKYQDKIREAILNAVKSVRSCVLFYRDISYELEKVFEDEKAFNEVDGALWLGLHGLKLGDVALYKIYVDPDDGSNDVVAVSFNHELTEEQLKVLEEVASLFGVESYDRYDEGEGQFFESMPIYGGHREEVYVVLHNLVKLWTGCGGEDE
jgi:hypothetical protein